MESSDEQQTSEYDFCQADSIELLINERHCPLCGCAYDETHPVHERDGVITLAVQCHCCGTGSLITVKRAMRLSPPDAMDSELTSVERAFFGSLRPISEDDVGRMRRLMRTHRGDLRELLQ